MKTISQLRALVTKVGGTLEEDLGYRDMRVLQAVAPYGQWWANERVQCMRIEWATGNSPTAQFFNHHAFLEAKARLAAGLEPIPAELAALYTED